MTPTAQTILEQLGGNRMRVMTGAKLARFSETTLYLKFMKGRDSVNQIRVTLDPSDTYTVEFMNVRGRVTTKTSDVYCDDLIPLFERVTGLYVAL